MNNIKTEAIELLTELIKTPSFSKEEDKTASIIEIFLKNKGKKVNRKHNNVWVVSHSFSDSQPTILLNSHHDTVKPVSSWTKEPFCANTDENGKIYGLGSNDAGASLVSLLSVFLYFDKKDDLPFNLLFAATAEEEIMGKNGMESMIEEFGDIELGIIGEPTQMQMAIAEKGLMVLDCTAKGKAGHAARNEGINAIYEALEDLNWFRNYCFPNKSEMLGEVKMTVSQINAGQKHNVVPDECHFVVDVRPTDKYDNKELLEIIQKNVKCDVKARSTRLNSSSLSVEHPIVKAGKSIGLSIYGSPTTSDQAVIPFKTLKIGPGDSARSHTADEYILIDEIHNGIETYIKLLENLKII